MNDPSLRLLPAIAAATAAAWLLATSGCAAWRLGEAAALVRQSEPLQHTPANPSLRLLVVGDSTAVGTGASSPAHSLAGLLAHDDPSLWIENRARNGATLAEVAAQLQAGGHYDWVFVMAGGNDVMRVSGFDHVQADLERVAGLARSRGTRVVLMPCGNVGDAPFFYPPLSWLMSERSRELRRWARAAAARTSAVYVDLFRERDDDPFVALPELNAADGLHPSDAGYRVWLGELRRQAGLPDELRSAQLDN